MTLKARTTYLNSFGTRVCIAGPTGATVDGNPVYWSIQGDHYTEDGRFVCSKRTKDADGKEGYERYTSEMNGRNIATIDDSDEARKWWIGVVTDREGLTVRYAKDLRALGACPEAVKWLGERSLEDAWKDCPRGEWLLWYCGRTINCEPWTDGRKPLLAAALDCAETAKQFWSDASRSKIEAAIAVLRGWIAGTVTVEDAKQARRNLYAAASAASYAAAFAASASDASAAAFAAAFAAYAASAYAASAASYAASAYASFAADARDKALADCADIVRRHYPEAP